MNGLNSNVKWKVLLWFVFFLVVFFSGGSLREGALADQGRLVDIAGRSVEDVGDDVFVGIVLLGEDSEVTVYRPCVEDNRWQMPKKVVFEKVSDN